MKASCSPSSRKRRLSYRWLEALRDALQHGDIDAFKWRIRASASRRTCGDHHHGPCVHVGDRTTDNRTKPWLKRAELEKLDH